MHVPLHLVLELGRLFKGQTPQECLGYVSREQGPAVLSCHRVHDPLTPPCGRAREGAQLSSLQVLEASYDQMGLYDALAVDYLPL